MTDERPEGAWWFDEQEPHEAALGRAQVEGLLARLGPGPARVLELGCGVGRVLGPLVAAGHDVTGVDRNADALAACRASLPPGAPVRLVASDFRDDAAFADGPFDAILCVGNTWMTIDEVEDAVALLRRVRAALAPGGWFAIDDVPADFWPELTEGNWQAGLAEDGSAQLVWHESDAVFALRHGADIDAAAPQLQPGDVRYRMWTDGALALAARAGGLSAAERDAPAHLLLLRRSTT